VNIAPATRTAAAPAIHAIALDLVFCIVSSSLWISFFLGSQ
jgi:hypothetical protein